MTINGMLYFDLLLKKKKKGALWEGNDIGSGGM